MNQEGYNIDNRLHDCGLMIYDFEHQDIFCGGSGCACSMCVSMAKLLKKLEETARSCGCRVEEAEPMAAHTSFKMYY